MKTKKNKDKKNRQSIVDLTTTSIHRNDESTTMTHKKRKRDNELIVHSNNIQQQHDDEIMDQETTTKEQKQEQQQQQQIHPNYTYILAPMVGASELAFRLLCRKYGTQLCYTPMMSAIEFANSESYRTEYFHSSNVVHRADHPLYVHVYANTIHDFVNAAKMAVQIGCDGIDLNLGCPQRTAYIGQYGSYLCTNDTQTHTMVASMITAAVHAIQNVIPVTAKIRLLHPKDYHPTLQLCKTLHANHKGVSLIAIHARQRASWERTGPGARDGPADIQQVASIVKAIRNNNKNNNTNVTTTNGTTMLRIVTNGNTISYHDVQHNLHHTQADGIMSAEGLLDNPALYVNRYKKECIVDAKKCDTTLVTIWTLKEQYRYKYKNYNMIPTDDMTCNIVQASNDICHSTSFDDTKMASFQAKIVKYEQKLQHFNETIEHSNNNETIILKIKQYQEKLQKIQRKLLKAIKIKVQKKNDVIHNEKKAEDDTDPYLEQRTVPLQSLLQIANDKVLLAMEYLDLASIYTPSIRTIVFHVRRMCKHELQQYQLMQECLLCTSITEIRTILNRIIDYRIDPASFVYDSQRAQDEKDALERQKHDEGKRKAYEERMIRKAKREGRTSDYYLNIGTQLPTQEQMIHYKTLPRTELIDVWKQNHSQHCLSFHMDSDKCKRGRSCAFLHVENANLNMGQDASQRNCFQENDECAG